MSCSAGGLGHPGRAVTGYDPSPPASPMIMIITPGWQRPGRAAPPSPLLCHESCSHNRLGHLRLNRAADSVRPARPYLLAGDTESAQAQATVTTGMPPGPTRTT
jgi:hypothetical protein